jgi:hypothetical protein
VNAGHKDFGMGGHHSARPRTETWLTPPPVLAALGGAESFDLDPCAATDQPWPTARRHYTIYDNGLALPWEGRVWLNPPYSSAEIRAWMTRMVNHGQGLALIFARTETETFFRCVWERCDALLFLEGRLNFHLPDGRRAKANAGAPSVICAYGRDDADCLAASGLAGAFVPLKLRAFVHGLERPSAAATWAAEIDKAMAALGDRATLAELYKALAGHPKAARNSNYQAKIRQELQRGPFKRVEPGLWERMQ